MATNPAADNTPHGQQRSLPLGKRVLFATVLALLVLLVAELLAYAAIWVRDGRPLSWAQEQKERDGTVNRMVELNDAALPTQQPEWLEYEVLHPYLGYVTVSDASQPTGAIPIAPTDIIPRRSPDRVIIGVFGGSVAAGFGSLAMPTVVEALEASSQFTGKTFSVINLAMGGHKQPQQLLTLNYMLARGAEFDIVINVDGFNEVALHAPENGKKGVAPIYPRNWYFRVAAAPDATLARLIGRASIAESQAVANAELFSHAPLRYSPLCTLIWRWRNRTFLNEFNRLTNEARNYQPQGSSPYLITGPSLDKPDEQENFDHLVAIWKRCSIQMDRLCRANGTRYYHFLQPNQYVPGSKPKMSQAERDVAFFDNHPYKPGVLSGYPLLIRTGQSLIDKGVHFTDLTQIYVDVEEKIYRDSCCHVNPLGNQIMGAHAARVILADLETDETAARPPRQPLEQFATIFATRFVAVLSRVVENKPWF